MVKVSNCNRRHICSAYKMVVRSSNNLTENITDIDSVATALYEFGECLNKNTPELEEAK